MNEERKIGNNTEYLCNILPGDPNLIVLSADVQTTYYCFYL